MAIGFFRRHKKLMIGIMVVLMVSFGGGAAITQWIFGSGRGGDYVHSTMDRPECDVTRGDINQAENDLDMLKRIGVGQLENLRNVRDESLRQNFLAFFILLNHPDNADRVEYAYAPLIKESEKSGLKVTNDEINSFVLSVGMNTDLEIAITTLRSATNQTEKKLLAMISRWLGVVKTMQLAIPRLPISIKETETLYRDINELMKIRMVSVPVKGYVKKLTPLIPTEKQINELFNEHKNSAPGVYSDEKGFGFGYRLPRRVRLHYLLLDNDVIDKVCKPFESEIKQEYRDNKTSYTKSVPVEVKAPDDSDKSEDAPEKSETEPETEPETKIVQMRLSEAREQIINKITFSRFDKFMTSLDENITNKLVLFEEEGSDEEKAKARLDATAYDCVLDEITEDAADTLATKIEISIDQETASDAIDILGEAAGVRICYPFDSKPLSDDDEDVKIDPGDIRIDPEVIVTLAKSDCKTLGDALKALSGALNIPVMEWSRCSGINAIFPTTVKSMFPVVRGLTPLASEKELSDHEILKTCMTKKYERLSVLAVKVGLRGPGLPSGIPPLNYDGKMSAGFRGRLIWRVTEVAEPEAPKGDTPSDKVRTQVIADWKTLHAFNKARKTLAHITDIEALDKLVADHKLETVADDEKFEDVTTGLFSRERGIRELSRLGVPTDWVFRRGQRYPEAVPKKAIGSYAPPDPDKPFGRKGKEVVMIELPSAGVIVLAQRLDYIPVVKSEFEKAKAYYVKNRLGVQWETSVKQWLGFEGIKNRTGLKVKSD